MISILLFILLVIAGTAFFTYNVIKVKRNIFLGKELNRKDNSSERWKIMTLVALGQKKMFSRPIPAILHLFLYAAFVITQIELIEIFADGTMGSHRILRSSLGSFYTFMISFIEILSVLAFIGTIAFLSRRNLLKVPRLANIDLKGWPKIDANTILFAEITLICFIFMMNGADEVLYSQGLSHAEKIGDSSSLGFLISSKLGPILFGGLSEPSLHIIERIGWWGHIAIVFGFLNYLPYSKHFHLLLAFPNTFYSNLNPKGKFTNLDSVTNEVKAMMDPSFTPPVADPNVPMRFGAKDVVDLTWKQLLDAYTCTECGRCTSSCPANITGKLLSPRKIMMSTRDRLVEVGKIMDVNKGEFKDDGKALLGDYIKPEELWACTSCNACVQECPVNIDPLSIIIEMRRFIVMEQSAAPTALNSVFTNIENNGAPWQFSQADRLNWKNE